MFAMQTTTETRRISLELGFDGNVYADYGSFMMRACAEREFSHVISVKNGSRRHIIPDVSLLTRGSGETYQLPSRFADRLIDFARDYPYKRNCATFACSMAGVELTEDVTEIGAKLPDICYERIDSHERLTAGDVVRMIPRELAARPEPEVIDGEHWYVVADSSNQTALHVLGKGGTLYLMPTQTVQRIYPDRELYLVDST